jgi:hypothetical protein
MAKRRVAHDTVGFIIEANDRVSVDIFRLVDEFAHKEFTPIGLGRDSIRSVPNGCGVYLADRIENALAFDDLG